MTIRRSKLGAIAVMAAIGFASPVFAQSNGPGVHYVPGQFLSGNHGVTGPKFEDQSGRPVATPHNPRGATTSQFEDQSGRRPSAGRR